MHQTHDSKKKILHRLKIARGHLDKVITMVDQDEYCIDIIHQSQAVQSALKESDNVLLENHLQSCVINQIQEGKGEQAIQEIMKVFKKAK